MFPFAGDINNDGVDDIIIGAPRADHSHSDAGASYVVFGKTGSFDAEIELGDLTSGNGFRIEGRGGDDRSGTSVSYGGDINNDGIDDLLIGAEGADARVKTSNNQTDERSDAGEAYVLFGKSSSFGTSFNLDDLDGENGALWAGRSDGFSFGQSVANAGDVNGDGVDDFIVGDPGADIKGIAYIVFGRDVDDDGDFSSDAIGAEHLTGNTGVTLEGMMAQTDRVFRGRGGGC